MENDIIPFISKPRLDEEHNLNLQRFLLKDVKVQYMNKKLKGHKIHVFKITDNIVKSPRFINLYSKCSAFISEYFTCKWEENRVKHECGYATNNIRDIKYKIIARCDSSTYVKDTYYTCNILFLRDNSSYNGYIARMQELKEIQQETTYKYNDIEDNIIYTYAEPKEINNYNYFLKGIKLKYINKSSKGE